MIQSKEKNIKLTKRQQQIFNFIVKNIKTFGFPPSVSEFQKRFSFKSPNAVQDHLNTLERKGFITRHSHKSRGIEVLVEVREKAHDTVSTIEIPIIGHVAAGEPILAQENIEGKLSVDKTIVNNPNSSFALQVKGDSMINAGILDGDFVVVQQQSTADQGEIVVALIGEEATVKRFYKENNHVKLLAENENFAPIIITPQDNDVQILGKVKGVIRKFGPNRISSAIKCNPRPLNVEKKAIFFETGKIKILNEDILLTENIKPSSIDLIVTSPPYNLDIKYGSNDDKLSYEEYLNFTKEWMGRCFEFAKDDGRFCLNIPLDKNKNGQQSVCADITSIAKRIGWHYHSTIIWNEGNISRRTAWGSWLSASAPYVIAPVEVIVVFYKKFWKKQSPGKSDITKEEFMGWTNGVWTFNGESKKRIGHPAPFPIELPRRCIKLFSYTSDTVLDPFLGSGSTLLACMAEKRKGIGVDIDKQYCVLAKGRLLNYSAQSNFDFKEAKCPKK